MRAARADWYGWRGADFGMAAKAGVVVRIFGFGNKDVVADYFREEEYGLDFPYRIGPQIFVAKIIVKCLSNFEDGT